MCLHLSIYTLTGFAGSGCSNQQLMRLNQTFWTNHQRGFRHQRRALTGHFLTSRKMGFGFKRCTLWLFKNCWNEKLWGFVSAVPYQKHISAGRQWILPFCWAPRYPLLSVSLIVGFDVFLQIRPNEKKKKKIKNKLSGGDFWISEFPQQRFSGGSGGGRPPGALRAPRPRCAPRHSGTQRVTGSGDRKAVK